jgi:hypothetical protein
VILLTATAVIGIVLFLWLRSRAGDEQPRYNYKDRYRPSPRDAQPVKGPVIPRKPVKTKLIGKKSGRANSATQVADADLETQLFQEKMRKLQYSQLPINSFKELRPAGRYRALPISNDPSLLNAIEESNDEFEDDESAREIAVRILMAFETSNSVEALSQIALYDLSANLRSRALTVLADFDHESVFETVLLACADPSRDVRAAAARGLFRLSFDRADAWQRIIDTDDVYRMRYAARAAMASGIVRKSFDRLIHDDSKIAYEAFTLVTLLITVGEFDEIFETLHDHKDERVKFALLHVLKVTKDKRALDRLREMSKLSDQTKDVAERILETIASCEIVPA